MRRLTARYSGSSAPAGSNRPRLAGRPGERGVALILTLLVLTIVLVITVQFTYSVRLEERIVANQSNDQALALAARGAIWHLNAQLQADDQGEITVGEFELGEVDTNAEPYMDPQATAARQFSAQAGDGSTTVQIDYLVEDLDRRFNLNWLYVENEGFREHAEAALKRLIVLLGHEAETADTFIEFLRGKAETDATGAAGGTTAGATTGGLTGTNTAGNTEDQVPPRVLLSLDELWEFELDTLQEFLLATDQNNEPVEGKKPVLDFLTVHDTPGLNVNTALPEVFAAWLPPRDQRRPQPQQLNNARRVKAAKELVTRRPHVEGEENFEATATAEDGTATDGTTDPNDTTATDPTDTTTTDPTDPTGEPVDPTTVEGSDFIGEGPLNNARDIAKLPTLRFIFNAQAGQGPPRGGGGGGGAGAGAGAGAGTTGVANLRNWYDVLTFKSRVYRMSVNASGGAGVTRTFECILVRGQNIQDAPVIETTILEWREVLQ